MTCLMIGHLTWVDCKPCLCVCGNQASVVALLLLLQCCGCPTMHNKTAGLNGGMLQDTGHSAK